MPGTSPLKKNRRTHPEPLAQCCNVILGQLQGIYAAFEIICFLPTIRKSEAESDFAATPTITRYPAFNQITYRRAPMKPSDLRSMGSKERLEVMELLWSSFQQDATEIESPAWHGDVLRDRKTKLLNGTATFIPIKELKARYRATD